jgi:hypothetical protein
MRTRHRSALRAASVVCLLSAAACGSTAPPGGDPADREPATASPEPGGSPSAGPGDVPPEAAAVEEAVRGYFQAVADDDYAGKARYSSGELVTLAGWELMVALSFGSALGTLEIDRLEVQQVTGVAATVGFHAELRLSGFAGDPPSVFSGPVSLAREPDGWKVVDYVRDGRRQVQAIHSMVRGSQERGGVAVTVLGAHLAADAIFVAVRATNTTEESFGLQPGTIVAADGRRLEFGEPSATQRAVLPSAPLETYVYWSGRSLSVDAAGFRLVLTFSGSAGTTLEFDVPVTLLD